MSRVRVVLPYLAPILVGVSMLLLVKLADTQATSRDRNDARAAVERHQLATQISGLEDDVRALQATVKTSSDLLLQFQADNATLREQLLRRGIKPDVPARAVYRPPSTTRPPSGSGPTTTTTRLPTSPPCQVCVGATCVTTPQPVCP